MTVNSIGATEDYMEVPSFLKTTTAGKKYTLRSERTYSAHQRALLEAVPGVPAVDYPVYSNVPLTSFTCYGKFYGGKQDIL